MAQNAGTASTMEMIRPETIMTLPSVVLNDGDKQKYQQGLTKLWEQVNTQPPDSEIYKKAVNKIKEVSRDLYMRMARRRQAASSEQAQNQANQQTLALQQPPTPQLAQQPQQPQTTARPSTANAQTPQQSAQQPQAAQPVRTQSQQGQQPPNAPQPVRLSQQAEKFLREFEVFPPQNVTQNSPEYAAYKQRILTSLQKCLLLSDRYGNHVKQLEMQEQQMTQSGQVFPPEKVSQREQYRQGIGKAKMEFDRIKTENERNKQLLLAQRAQNGQQEQNALEAQLSAQQQPVGHSGQNGQNLQQQPKMPAPQLQPGLAPSQPPLQPQPSNGQQMQPQPTQQQPQNPPMSHPTRPQPGPQQFSVPQPGGHPQALSHQDAMAAINRTYSDQVPKAAAPTQPSTTARTPTASATPIGQAGAVAAQPFQNGPSTTSIASTKMQIPQKLNLTATQPVQMAAPRPTLGAGPQGMIGQPGLQKPPGFTLEGEEGRVLSKKKLDELVRQVTGGGEGLTPEVEEAVLSLADDFVDSVLTSACRLAKIRPNSTLDIRDVQVVLERNYNIRVPGYSLDEVRTVRKFQPAAGWTQKMNAVQAAKVMGKNDA